MENILVFDGHNDVLSRLYREYDSNSDLFFQRTNYGQIDLPRMKEGGVGGGLFAVFVPQTISIKDDHSFDIVDTADGYEIPLAHPIEMPYAQRIVQDQIMLLKTMEAQSQGQLRISVTADDVESCLSQGIISAVLHFEGAESIDPELFSLPDYYLQGLRSVGLVWSRPNNFGFGVPYKFPHSPDIGPGLTDAGKTLVAACNQLGIIVDLAHINEKGFWDVAQRTSAPLVVTHTAAFALCPISRNLTDSQLDAIAESKGLVGVNFAVRTLRSDGRPNPDTTLHEIIKHIVYITQRIGIEHVAFGSDFDGTTIPLKLKDITGMPLILKLLQEAGFDEISLQKLCYANWLRVLRATWK